MKTLGFLVLLSVFLSCVDAKPPQDVEMEWTVEEGREIKVIELDEYYARNWTLYFTDVGRPRTLDIQVFDLFLYPQAKYSFRTDGLSVQILEEPNKGDYDNWDGTDAYLHDRDATFEPNCGESSFLGIGTHNMPKYDREFYFYTYCGRHRKLYNGIHPVRARSIRMAGQPGDQWKMTLHYG
ncbi:hypothetical protein CAPTEDRAFT_185361 [Capitella teleta]|uniref:Uncharacterized protein n=1 Tax=Capitella teleta TaxID=283909 RepID=R7TGW7_CAPTE|nr:hypothetical protein CAPTEDRAFT_185361 [Capitella teleta]|eukprot:ELT90796.1 hypothetical protein CAPTEDRAFT_185361 [Capitella teleta]